MSSSGDGEEASVHGGSEASGKGGKDGGTTGGTAIAVVGEPAGGVVIEDAVVRGCGIKAETKCRGSERPGDGEGREDAVFEFDPVICRGEIGDGVAVGGGVEAAVESEDVVAGAAYEGVVAAIAVQEVVEG